METPIKLKLNNNLKNKTMKKLLFSAWMLAVGAWCAVAQVTTEPAFITNNYTGKIIITFDPAQGNKGMVGATACYAHTGA